MQNLVGRQFGPYRMVAPLGEGGMAAVYKAYQPNVDRFVALKILPPYFAHDPQFVGRFRQEARILAKLQHPNILPVYDFGEADNYTYIVMPLVEAGSLAKLLEQGPLPWPEIQRIISQVGSALDYAHSQGTVHRDVKPSNILIDQYNNCLLTDFGIAKMVESASVLTRTGGILGTPAYMSPEQIRGERLDGRSDIYSLGIVLYEMVTGRPPFRAETPPAIFIKHLQDPLPPPHIHRPDVPPDVERVVLKALAKDREDRFQSAVQMAAALAQAIVAEPVPQPEPEPAAAADLPPAPKRMASTEVMAPTRPKRPAPRWLLPVAGVLAVAVLAIVLALVIRPGREQPPPAVELPPVAESRPTSAPTTPPTEEPAEQPAPAQPVAAEPTEPTEPVQTEEPQATIRVRLDSSSDWAEAFFWFSPPGAHLFHAEMIETGGNPTEAELEDLKLQLTQGLKDAELAKIVYLVEEITFVDLQPDQLLRFSLTSGCLGRVVLEVQNMATGSPVTVARLASEGEEGCGGNPPGIDVAVADLLTTSPPPALTPLPTEVPGRALYNVGMVFRDRGEYAEAITVFDQAAAMGWETAQLYAGRAWACREWYYSSGGCDLERAIADWDRAIELDSTRSIYYAERGEDYHGLGQLDRCIAGYSKALELDPEEPYYWRNKGTCLLDMGDPQAALEHYNRAIDLGAEDAGFWVDRAWTYRTLGELDLAIADWTHAMELELGNPYHWHDRGWCYADKGDNSAARSDFETFMHLTAGDPDWDDMRAEVQTWLNSH